MMRLIERIVDKVLNDEGYAFGALMFVGATTFLLCGLSSNAYREKLNAEVKLAEITAGHFGCECKCKCK
jgi:hypothetical protein